MSHWTKLTLKVTWEKNKKEVEIKQLESNEDSHRLSGDQTGAEATGSMETYLHGNKGILCGRQVTLPPALLSVF